jgi:hypothetical protein
MTFHASILFFSASEYGLIRVHYILTTSGIHLTNNVDNHLDAIITVYQQFQLSRHV